MDYPANSPRLPGGKNYFCGRSLLPELRKQIRYIDASMKNVLESACFAAKKHTNQRRKNAGNTPYINHPLEVAHLLATVGGVTDEDILSAALLHDTIEDTETLPGEISARFGDVVLSYVLEVSDDKMLPKAERKRFQAISYTHLTLPTIRLV